MKKSTMPIFSAVFFLLIALFTKTTGLLPHGTIKTAMIFFFILCFFVFLNRYLLVYDELYFSRFLLHNKKK